MQREFSKNLMKTVYIISDLHLSAKRQNIVQIFTRFIDTIANKDNELYILGDFFDYWVGDDDLSDFHLHIINILKAASTKGLLIYLMHGNRDFLLGKEFAKLSQVTLIDDPYVLVRDERSFLLMHGDLLCTDDKSYQYFRKFVRNTLIQRFYLMLPLSLRRKLANKIRHQSQQKNARYKIIDVTEKGISQYISDYPILIHGHTHQQGVHHKSAYTRYVLGDWFHSGNYLKIDSDNSISVVDNII